jgi:hypothetical protein
MYQRLTLLFCCLFLSLSCSKKEEDNSITEGPKFKAAKAILTHPAKCGLCHVGTTTTLDFSTDKTITSNASKIAFSLQFNTMPPPPTEGGFILTPTDKNAILQWTNAGGDISD